jgi:serine/threonine protein kinase
MAFYAIEVLLALSYLHSNCIIYRDLKPENIVVSMTERGHLKLVDFGFAKMLKTINQRTYTNCGTPAYIAPEVLIDNNGHGHEVDVWSLGVLMCEIISGHTPFHAESTLEVYENINKC